MRRSVLVAILVLAGAALAGASAFACTNLATVSPSAEAVRPGDRITLVGTSFPVSRTSDRPTTGVEVHWGTASGPLMAATMPDRTGTISVTIEVPEAPAGHAVIVVTQRRPLPTDGASTAAPAFVDEPGTPARTSVRVRAPGEPRDRPPATRVVAGAADNSNTTLLVLTAVTGAVALSLFGGGFIAFIHQHRTRAQYPQAWPPW